MMKVCTACGASKPRSVSHFASDGRKSDGLRGMCRSCQSARQLARYYSDRERALNARAEYKAAVASGARQVRRRTGYVVEDRDLTLARERAARRLRVAERLSRRMRNRLRAAIGESWSEPPSVLLGCTTAELMVHLERQFRPGMTWENRGKWHVDHIRPLSAFDLSDPEQRRQACHYTNLQPLWASENIAKGARQDWAA